MILKNIHISIFVSLLFCLTHIKAKPETIKIINKTDSALNVNFTVPEQTVASIKLKKLDALHDAIVADSSEKIRKAVLDGADVNHLKDGKTPLLWAVILRHYNAIETLLHLGAKPDDNCTTQATTMKDIKSLLLLVQHGSINIDIQKIANIIELSLIHRKGDSNDFLPMIKELVNRGYNANDLWSPVMRLAYYRATEGQEAVRFLLSRGANANHAIQVNIGTETVHCNITMSPLIMAVVGYPNKQIVKILIDAGADINKPITFHHTQRPSCSLLSYALEYSDSHVSPKERKEVIAFLLEQGAPL